MVIFSKPVEVSVSAPVDVVPRLTPIFVMEGRRCALVLVEVEPETRNGKISTLEKDCRDENELRNH